MIKLHSDSILQTSYKHSKQNIDFLLFSLALIALAYLLYLPALRSGLLSDDWFLSYSDKPFLGILKTLTGEWTHGTSFAGFYRPIPRIALFLQSRLFGTDGYGQHLVNFGLFSSTALIIGVRIRLMMGKFLGLVAFSLFLLNPLNTETVSWVSSQTDLWAGLFFALSLACLPITLDKFSWMISLLSLVSGLFCYMSKESAVALGPITVLWFFTLLIRSKSLGLKNLNRSTLLLFGGHLILWVFYFVWRWILFGQIMPANSHPSPENGWLWHIPLVSLVTIKEYLGLFVEMPPFQMIISFPLALLWFFLMLMMGIAVCMYKHWWVLLSLCLAFIIAAAPSILSGIPAYGSFEGSRRVLYFQNMIVAVFISYVIHQSTKHHRSVENHSNFTIWHLVVGILILFMSIRIYTSSLEWMQAGHIRDRMTREISQALENHGSITLLEYQSPDHVGEAYIMRNSLEYYTLLEFGERVELILRYDEDFEELSKKIGPSIFKVNYLGEHTTILHPIQ